MSDKQKTGLQKIDALLEAMGISEEARKEFVTVCESWHTGEKDKLRREFQSRLERAKQVCAEETEAHKASLSRGVQMFLESRAEEISKASSRQAAIAEPEAVSQLKKIKSILGGINIDSAESAQVLQAESKKNALLVKQVAELQESIARERAKSSKFADLSEKAITRQRTLEEELKKTRVSKTLSEHKVKARKPLTTTSPISENTSARGVADDDMDIDMIVENMD